MKNPYRIHLEGNYVSDWIRAAIFPFALIAQAIDNKILKKRNASLIERLKFYGEMSGCTILQLGMYANLGYTFYEMLR
jgi:hypothetical protein